MNLPVLNLFVIVSLLDLPEYDCSFEKCTAIFILSAFVAPVIPWFVCAKDKE
jgi:hypothetical protein